jgi:ABC-type transporter MlaC component
MKMKTTLPFDTLEYMEELKNAGVDQKQAQAMTKATQHAFSQMLENNQVATKEDIQELRTATKEDLQELKMDLYAFIVKSVMTTIAILGGLQALFHFIK